MTVITTPARRLSVRSTPTRHAVSALLQRLAAERATGVLLRECGSLYLSDGEVVHAESPRSPGLEVLLTTGGILDTEGWRKAVDTAGAGLRVGRFLVDSGRVARGALELCHAGALFDAAYFALGPSSVPGSFRYGAAHWLGPIRPVPVATVAREALRRRDLLHRIWPDPATDDAPLIRAAAPAAPPIPARQGAVLDQVDGSRTAGDISLTLGRPAFHTLVDIRRLAAAGLISTGTRDTGGPPASTGEAEPTAGDEAPPPTGQWPLTTTDPDIALLQRLRDALEAL